jgi:hypothetical protein
MADVDEFIRNMEESGVPLADEWWGAKAGATQAVGLTCPVPSCGVADEWWGAEAGATQAVGLSCPVPSCGVVVGCANLLRRHWMASHERKLVIFLCPIEGCGWRSKRADKVKEHDRKCHEERFLPWTEDNNVDFVDPGETHIPQGVIQARPTLNPGERFPPRRRSEVTERRVRKRGSEGGGEQEQDC